MSESINAWELVLSLGVEFAGAFVGVLFGFSVDRMRNKRRFAKRVAEIVPHIYIELYDNFLLFQRYQGYGLFYRESIRLKTVYWEIFQSELAKWEEHNVVPLTRIYYNLTTINKHVEARNETQPYGFVAMTMEIKKLIQHKLDAYEDWYVKNPEAFKEFQKAMMQYRIEIVPKSSLGPPLEKIKDRMKAKGLELN